MSAALPHRPSWAFMRAHLSRWIAMGAGAGLSPVAPGTMGTLLAWAASSLLQAWITPWVGAMFLLLGLPIGWWACTRCAQDLALADPGCIVWDEIWAFALILLIIMPASWQMQLLAFAVFRFFDAAKPQPVRWADRAFKGTGWRGGFGIMFDDIVAAFCSLLVLALLQYGLTLYGLAL